jgi:predicted ABC-type ATPase
MLAGPNGSGKSTLKRFLQPEWLGVYVNPDDIEKSLMTPVGLNLTHFGISFTRQELIDDLNASDFFKTHSKVPSLDQIKIENNCLIFVDYAIHSYLASTISSILRNRLTRLKKSFSFETVMSSQDKIEAMDEYGLAGARRYLYFIATDDPEINVNRVQSRVVQGGHSVPEDKIRSRYFRSLDNLYHCIQSTDRAYLFDNSQPGQNARLIAEITQGQSIRLVSENIPNWVDRFLLKKSIKQKD